MSEVAHIPQLRFPEFEGSWSSVSILGTTNPELKYGIVDGPFGSNLKTIHYKKSGIPIITSGYVTDGFFNADSYLYVTEEKFNKEKRSAVNGGDIVMAKIGARCGSSAILPKNHPTGILSGNALKITVDNNSHSTNFIWQILWSLYQGHKLDLLRTVGAQPAISIANLKKYKLSLPTKPEQQKIAAFLTEVDTKIEQLSKKQELLGEYKKGLMQQIFSQAIRFKADDGSDFPDWEEVKLGNIGEFKTSSVDKKIVEGQKLIQLVNYMNVYKHENIKNNSTKDLMIVSANETQLNASDLKKGDILFTPSSETPDDIGHSVVIFEDLMDTLYSYHLMRFRPKVQLDILYSHYFCNIPDVLRQISRVATGSTRFTISVGEFSKIQINLPSLLEQTKIANFLSAIDNKIEKVGKQLVESKQFKKALLQQMFV